MNYALEVATTLQKTKQRRKPQMDNLTDFLKSRGIIEKSSDEFWTCTGIHNIALSPTFPPIGYTEKYNGESTEELKTMPIKKCPNCGSELSLVTNITKQS